MCVRGSFAVEDDQRFCSEMASRQQPIPPGDESLSYRAWCSWPELYTASASGPSSPSSTAAGPNENNTHVQNIQSLKLSNNNPLNGLKDMYSLNSNNILFRTC